MKSFAGAYFEELRRVCADMDLSSAAAVGEAILRTWQRGGTVYTAGNGGSASTASHFACDLSKLTIVAGMPRLRALSLCDNTELLTAWSNDSSYADVFSEQARDLLRPQDLVVCISGSGNSENVLRLAAYAHSQDVATIGLIGFEGGKLKDLVDLPLIVRSRNMQIIEDMHLTTCHMLASLVRAAIRNYAASSAPVAAAGDFTS